MFELFTEDARRALLFARAKTTERQGDVTTPEDLLEGPFLSSPHILPWCGSRLTNPPTETAEDFVSRFFDKRDTIPHSEASQLEPLEWT
jgi:hypothetical protein